MRARSLRKSSCQVGTHARLAVARAWLIPRVQSAVPDAPGLSACSPAIFCAFVRQPSSSHFRVRPMGVPACQQDINDGQQHHHESVGKEPAISQHENVTQDYGSHPPNSQSPLPIWLSSGSRAEPPPQSRTPLTLQPSRNPKARFADHTSRTPSMRALPSKRHSRSAPITFPTIAQPMNESAPGQSRR